MSFNNVLEVDFLKLYFQAVNAADIANSTGSASRYVSLHTGDPLESGAAANEQAYPGYARVAVTRTAGGWAVTSVDNGPSTANPVANIDFAVPASNQTPSTHWAVSRVSTLNSAVDMSGTLTPPLSMVAGTIPRVISASLISLD